MRECVSKKSFYRTKLVNGEMEISLSCCSVCYMHKAMYDHHVIQADETPCLVNKDGRVEYFNYLLTEIPEHLDNTNTSFIENLLPWSDKLPKECKKVTK